MAYAKFDFIKYSTLGAIAGVISYIVAVIFPLLGIKATQVFSNQFVTVTASVVDVDLRNQVLNSGYFKAIGDNVFSLLNSVGFNYMSFFGIIIGAIVVALVGRWIIGFMNNKYANRMRTFLTFTVGCAILGIFTAIYFKANLFNTIASMLLYGFLLGIVMQIIVNIKSFKYLGE